MVGITRAVVTALLAAVTAVALPAPGNGKGHGKANDNGGGSDKPAQVDLGYAVHEAIVQVNLGR